MVLNLLAEAGKASQKRRQALKGPLSLVKHTRNANRVSSYYCSNTEVSIRFVFGKVCSALTHVKAEKAV